MKRRAIDAGPPRFMANPNIDGEAHMLELATLFDQTTQKE